MQSSYYVFLALDLANQRAAEANARRLASGWTTPEPRPSRIRRVVARLALAVARAADAEIVGAPLATD
jgi:hypothetical protein